MAGGDFSHGPAEFLTSENQPAGDCRYAAGDNRAGKTLLHRHRPSFARTTTLGRTQSERPRQQAVDERANKLPMIGRTLAKSADASLSVFVK